MNGMEKCLDPQLWHACAGGMVQLPPVKSTVCYFPQGHAEHCQEKLDLVRMPPLILCKVETVKFLADKETDEVYAKIGLIPLRNNSDRDLYDEAADRIDAQEKPPSFAKTLTQSDANNGGGFSVPRYCAETIFPRLDYSSEPPVQTILARDVHGEVWKFRHIYRGTPRRHLLTTGWSNFVNQKKLVAGDSIIFLRADNGDLCVGVRRAKKEANSGWNSSSSPYGSYSPFLRIDEQRKICGGNGRGCGKVRGESVMEAASLAANGHPFDVVYYPRASAPEFCVKASSVGSSMRIQWCPGMRFKMPFENEDSSRISWFMGTISSVQSDDPIRWPNSPWRLLQVAWDEPDLLQDVKKVSPWLVELVSNMNMPAVHHLSPFSPPRKKIRIPQPSDFPFIGQIPMSSFQTYPNIGQGSSNHPFVHLTTQNIPAGIQGARHAQIELTQPNNIFLPRQLPPSKPLFVNFVGQSEQEDDGNVSCLLSLGLSNPSPKKIEDNTNLVKTPVPATFLLFGQPILTREQIFQTSSGSSDMNPANNLSDGSDSAVIQNSPTENLSDEGSPWFKRRNQTKSEPEPEPETKIFRPYHRELYGKNERTEALSESGAIKHGRDEPSHSVSFRSV